MAKTKFKYYISTVRLGLLQAVLLFSVFTFTGFNNNIQFAFLESVKTELVEDSKHRISYQLDFVSNKYKANHTKNTFDLHSCKQSWAALNLDRLITTKYKSSWIKFLAFDSCQIKLPTKTHSSLSDETPSYL